jgi:aryl-alcohol dehydrogenase-like predicted oxidoreductase
MTDETPQRHPVLQGIDYGIGTWSWGDRLYWGYGRGYSDADIRAAFDHCIEAGVRLFDTAEVYGQGRSETLLGQLLRESGAQVAVATKFMPYPWRLRRKALLRALRGSLNRLGMQQVDLYQIHWPMPPLTVETWMDAMVEAAQNGMIKAVGVSNYDRNQMQRAYDALVRNGVPLASNQVEYSLINRKIEKNGLLQHCLDLGVTCIAYSPIGMGLLTGKYTPENPPKGMRGGKYNTNFLAAIQPLVKLLARIGNERGGKSAAQVAINWTICKGALPIPGVKNMAQADQNTGAAGWRLTEAEVAALDEMSDRVENGRA